jgi:hypothetical protein
MKSYIVIVDDNRTEAYGIIASNISIDSLGESVQGINGLGHFEHWGNKIEFRTTADLKEIEFDNATLERLARYNMEQKNKTLLSEITYHENQLADIKAKTEQLKRTLDRIKDIAVDLIGGAEYEKVCEDEGEECEDE